MKRLAITASSLLFVAAVTGCGSSSPSGSADPSPSSASEPSAIDIDGAILLPGEYAGGIDDEVGSDCSPSGDREILPEPTPVDDVHEGAQVKISDADGKTVGLGTLGPGSTTAAYDPVNDAVAPDCAFPFTVSNVRADSAFYSVMVGKHSAEISKAKLASANIRFTD